MHKHHLHILQLEKQEQLFNMGFAYRSNNN